MFQRRCPPRLLPGTEMVLERSFVFHAPCGLYYSVLLLVSLHSSYHTDAQMVDKIWFDWQNKSPKNRYAFTGGSVEALDTFADFTEFPTGLPPFVNVSDRSGVKVVIVSHTLRSSPSV